MWNKGWRCEENCKTLFILLVLCTALLVWLEFCTQLLVLSRSNGLRSSMRQCLWRTSVKHEAVSLADFGQEWGNVFGRLRSSMRQCLWRTSVKHEARSLADFGQARGKVFGGLRSSTRQGLWIDLGTAELHEYCPMVVRHRNLLKLREKPVLGLCRASAQQQKEE